MILLNFSHPLTEAQIASVETLLNQALDRVVEVKTQFDHAQPFAEQVSSLMEATGLTAAEWQTLPILINLPSLNVITALLLAELHGRMGYFPAVLRLRPIPNTTPPQFEVVEILNLQQIRDAARKAR